MSISYYKIFFRNLIGITLFFSVINNAQPDSLYLSNQEFRVDSIKIMGNDITEDFIILRELTFKEGDIVTQTDLDYNKERIFSLQLFNKVSLTPVENSTNTSINIEVEETWYIYPIPFIRLQNESSNRYSYGISFSYKNFRGTNEHLRTVISLGYDPYFTLYYDNPSFMYKENLGFSIGGLVQNLNNKSKKAEELYGSDFKNKYYAGSFALTKRFDQFNDAYAQIGYSYIRTPNDKFINGISASGKSIDRIISLGFGYNYDSRDLKQFPDKGLFVSTNLLHKGFGLDDISYNIFRTDYRHYTTLIGQFANRWRITYRHTFGKLIPYYDHSYLGYDEYVRGRSLDVREGNNYLLLAYEISYPIIKEFDFSIKLPLIPKQLTSARISVHLTGFTDAGNAFYNSQKFKLSDFYYGYGFGITILALPYNAIRIEYAFGDNNNKEFIIGTGFSF